MINHLLIRSLVLLSAAVLAAACGSPGSINDPAASPVAKASASTTTSTTFGSTVTTAAPTSTGSTETTAAPTSAASGDSAKPRGSEGSANRKGSGDDLPATLGLTIEEFVERWNGGPAITVSETLVGSDRPSEPLDPRFETRVWSGLNAVGGVVVLTAYAEDGQIIDAAYLQPADAEGLGTIGFGRMLAAVSGRGLADLRPLFDQALDNDGLGHITTPAGDAIFCLASADGQATIFVSANIPGC